jgi:hypothetical protein
MKPYVELTKGALRAVPLVLVLGPALLMGAHSITNRPPESDASEAAAPNAAQ